VDYTSDHKKFESDLTDAISSLMSQPELLQQYGEAGRKRAISEFGWDAVAAQTISLYRSVIK
jgi:starch synthase